jgi:DNA uptake protein ComE-like DNA-binding protein
MRLDLLGLLLGGAVLAASSSALAADATGTVPHRATAASTVAVAVESRAARALVDINSADRATLKTLPGIGDAEAGWIVAGRPYRSKAELVTSKVLRPGVFAALRGAIVARQDTVRPLAQKALP